MPVEVKLSLPVCRGPGAALQKTRQEACGSRWSAGRTRHRHGKILASRVARDNGRWGYPIVVPGPTGPSERLESAINGKQRHVRSLAHAKRLLGLPDESLDQGSQPTTSED
ncbi:hypothetical protein NDU88_006648 [Pleurodeles waltl]|uniref:Uncharacterized protein n=1 Tax=Pleurodeles waltl TaxID=8319 RepID=A0AAV7RSQ2_PLEWA|nr:hypothetical protein NDU88_006648 [Pleurodeles waltl]